MSDPLDHICSLRAILLAAPIDDAQIDKARIHCTRLGEEIARLRQRIHALETAVEPTDDTARAS